MTTLRPASLYAVCTFLKCIRLSFVRCCQRLIPVLPDSQVEKTIIPLLIASLKVNNNNNISGLFPYPPCPLERAASHERAPWRKLSWNMYAASFIACPIYLSIYLSVVTTLILLLQDPVINVRLVTCRIVTAVLRSDPTFPFSKRLKG